MDQQKMKKMNAVEVENDLTPEERALWEASIERDLREIAEGKPRKYISGDEFWGKLTNAVLRHYEKV